jgi:hypothetical protein
MAMYKEIRQSHEMGPWRGAIVTLVSTSRFGEIRACLVCGAEHARTACGEDCHDELTQECEVDREV